MIRLIPLSAQGTRKILPSGLKRILRRVVSGVAGHAEKLAATIRWELLDDETREFRRCLAENKPYFGPLMRSRQSSPKRNTDLQGIVELECALRGGLQDPGNWIVGWWLGNHLGRGNKEI